MGVLSAEEIAGPGTIVTCPKCFSAIGRLRKSLYQGWSFGLDAINFRPGQQPVKNRQGQLAAECRRCGTAYSDVEMSAGRPDVRRVHTQHGWLGERPRTVLSRVEKVSIEP